MVATDGRELDFGVDRRRLKTGVPSYVRQPFCRQLEERLLMYQVGARAVVRKKTLYVKS